MIPSLVLIILLNKATADLVIEKDYGYGSLKDLTRRRMNNSTKEQYMINRIHFKPNPIGVLYVAPKNDIGRYERYKIYGDNINDQLLLNHSLAKMFGHFQLKFQNINKSEASFRALETSPGVPPATTITVTPLTNSSTTPNSSINQEMTTSGASPTAEVKQSVPPAPSSTQHTAKHTSTNTSADQWGLSIFDADEGKVLESRLDPLSYLATHFNPLRPDTPVTSELDTSSTLNPMQQTTRLSETDQFVGQIIGEMRKDKRMGYFSTFLAKLFAIIAKKPQSEAEELCHAVPGEIDRLFEQEDKFIYSFGQPFYDALHSLSGILKTYPIEYLQNEAIIYHFAIILRKGAVTPRINSIISYIDGLMTETEGHDLLKLLVDVIKYPEGVESGALLRNVSTAIFAPYLKLTDPVRKLLTESINDAINKAYNTDVTESFRARNDVRKLTTEIDTNIYDTTEAIDSTSRRTLTRRSF